MDDQLARSLRLLLERESDRQSSAAQPGNRGAAAVALPVHENADVQRYEDQVASLYKERSAQELLMRKIVPGIAIALPLRWVRQKADTRPRCALRRNPDRLISSTPERCWIVPARRRAARPPSSSGTTRSTHPRYVTPAPGARLIDLKKEFVLPGLIDAHVHVFSDDEDAGAAGGDQPRRRGQSADRGQRAPHAGGRVHDRSRSGSDVHSVTALRDAILSGLVPGPTIVAAGAGISGPGGHADSRTTPTATPPRAADAGHQPCSGADDCRRAALAIRSRRVPMSSSSPPPAG